MYAFIASFGSDAIQVLSLEDPTDPQNVAIIENGEEDSNGDTYTMLDGPSGVDLGWIGDKLYLFVASRVSDGKMGWSVQCDVVWCSDVCGVVYAPCATTPSTCALVVVVHLPTAPAAVRAWVRVTRVCICVCVCVFAFVAGVSIIDVTDPFDPLAAGAADNGEVTQGGGTYSGMNGACGVKFRSISGLSCAFVTAKDSSK